MKYTTVYKRVSCDYCGGYGLVRDNYCPKCDGVGYDEKPIKVPEENDERTIMNQTTEALKSALAALRGIYMLLENGTDAEDILKEEGYFPLSQIREALENNGVSKDEIASLGEPVDDSIPF